MGGFVFDWLFRARYHWRAEREETRPAEERESERQGARRRSDRKEGAWGVGININIIALIALDRGGARAYDTLQITREVGTRRGGGGGVVVVVVQRAREDAKRGERVGYVGSIVTYPRATT